MNRRKTAIVTGGSRGIGRAVAERLVRDGFDLTIAARDEAALQVAAAELSSLEAHITTCKTDMAQEDGVLALADFHLEEHGGVDLLVLAAGVGMGGDLETFPLHRLDVMVEVNLRAPFALVQRLLPALRKAGNSPEGGRIVAIASITGVASEPGLAAYGATKAALISLCESITLAEGEAGVSATAISPGYVDTDMTAWIRDQIDPATMIRTSDVAEMVAAVARMSRFAAVPNIIMTRPGPQLWRA